MSESVPLTFVDQVANKLEEWCGLLAYLPHPALQYGYMQRAVAALLLLAPLCATLGTQVVNFRLAFFADAIGHSAFTGLGLGLLLAYAAANFQGTPPEAPMVVFGVVVALTITFYRRHSGLSSDTIIGIFSSTTVAFGLFLFTYLAQQGKVRGGDAKFLQFLRGSVMAVDSHHLLALAIFGPLAVLFIAFAFNRLLLVGLNADLARTMNVPVQWYEYGFAGVLALVVMFSIPIVGALVVTAMLVIPAAAARNFARNAGSVFWWGLLIAWTSSLGGLLLADYLSSAVGATIVLCTAGWFLVSQVYASVRGNR